MVNAVLSDSIRHQIANDYYLKGMKPKEICQEYNICERTFMALKKSNIFVQTATKSKLIEQLEQSRQTSHLISKTKELIEKILNSPDIHTLDDLIKAINVMSGVSTAEIKNILLFSGQATERTEALNLEAKVTEDHVQIMKDFLNDKMVRAEKDADNT